VGGALRRGSFLFAIVRPAVALSAVPVLPSIDPLADKNRTLEPSFVRSVLEHYGIDPGRKLLVQISRFDRLKDRWV